jgi:acetate kinase
MRVLVLNPGSSSMKFSIFTADTSSAEPILDGELSGIGSPHASITVASAEPSLARPKTATTASSIAEALQLVFATLSDPDVPKVDAVGYRVVHPGPKLREHQQITSDVLSQLEAAAAFAPLHDPVALQAIHAGMEHFPDLPHFACFDTIFHQTMPVEASIYPIPSIYRDMGVHRYGFHGLSCESIVRQMRLSQSPVPRRMVIAHLGSGCSVTALVDGVSIDTSMGLTPTGGVVMGTRPGDLDPGLLIYLFRQQQGSAASAASGVEALLNHDSGIAALSNMPNNVKDLRSAAASGNNDAVLSLKVFTRSITRALGGLCWLVGGIDAIVFAGGIGENDPDTRAGVLTGLETLGVHLDPALNASSATGIRTISAPDSPTQVLVVPAQEDLMIALHVRDMQSTKA